MEGEVPKPWERQEGETAKAFAAFCAYRDLGIERSLRILQQNLNKSTWRWLGEWSRLWAWVDRAAAWDSHLDEVSRNAWEKRKIQAAKRHADIGLSLSGKGLQALQGLDPGTLSEAEIARYLELGVKLERLALGLDTDRTTHVFTEDEKGRLAELRRLLLGEGGESGMDASDGD